MSSLTEQKSRTGEAVRTNSLLSLWFSPGKFDCKDYGRSRYMQALGSNFVNDSGEGTPEGVTAHQHSQNLPSRRRKCEGRMCHSFTILLHAATFASKLGKDP